MKARDWLVKQGLAKKGKGRMSKVAKEALEKAVSEGILFSDYSRSDSDTLTKVRVQAAPLQKLEKQREETVVWAWDQKKYWIAFDMCFGCNRAIAYCTHETPKLPTWVDSEVYWTKAVSV